MVSDPHVIPLRAYWKFNKTMMDVSIVPEPGVSLPPEVQAEVQLHGWREGRATQTEMIKDFDKHGKGQVTFQAGEGRTANHVIRVKLTDTQGREFPTRVVMQKRFKEYDWVANKTGISDKVLSPWTKLKVGKKGRDFFFDCWERQYRFEGDFFPSRVHALGEDILASPIRLRGKTNQGVLKWSGTKVKPEEQADDHAVFSQTAKGSALNLTGRVRVEYDGMIRVDWKAEATKEVTLEKLVLEIPFHTRHAKYFYSFPSSWGKMGNAFALPPKGLKGGFKPFIWMGDEERGFSWFCESDKNWYLQNQDLAVTVERRGKTTVLRLTLVDRPVLLSPKGRENDEGKMLSLHGGPQQGLGYTFGFQATPLRKNEQDAWDYRILCLTQFISVDNVYTDKERCQVSEKYLDELKSKGVRTVVLFEHWTDAEAYTRTPFKEALKRSVQAAHARGMSVLFYFGFLFSDRAPEWPELGEECISIPKRGYPFHDYLPQPLQSAWVVCYRNEWQDFIADGIARAMDEFDIDGVYLDGTGYPWPCQNLQHGCGYLRPDESIGVTYSIFSVRNMMKRIYTIVKSRKPEGQVNYHNSTCLTAPTVAWTTSCWDGEQFQDVKTGPFALDLIPLDSFRCEFMGKPFGIAAEFLCYGKPYTYEQISGVALLHDVPVRPFLETSSGDLDVCSKIWNAFDRFGKKESTWLPYWKNQKAVKATCGAYVSLYCHPSNGVLAVVSNLTAQTLKTTVRFNLKALQLSAVTTDDGITNKSLPIHQGTMTVELPSLGWKLIWLQPEGKKE